MRYASKASLENYFKTGKFTVPEEVRTEAPKPEPENFQVDTLRVASKKKPLRIQVNRVLPSGTKARKSRYSQYLDDRDDSYNIFNTRRR